jgi:hypothetical protein
MGEEVVAGLGEEAARVKWELGFLGENMVELYH